VSGTPGLFLHRKEIFLTEVKMPVLPCEVRSKTGSPCHRRAVVEIGGVAFCEPCAREQEAYFAIGELTQEDETQGSGSKLLVEALKRLRGKRTDGTEGTASGTHHRLSSLEETESLALTNG
jgi:hypothetical protein